MTIKIYIGNAWIDISSNVEPNITLQSRADDVFATGSCTAWLSTSMNEKLRYNIPPYTPIDVDGKVWMCKSTCSKYLTEIDTFVHQIEIIEASSILSCYIVGTKYFSNSGTNVLDRYKAEILCRLTNQKYECSISITNPNVLNKSIEYSFGTGSTLFDCLNEIARNHNLKMEVSYNAVSKSAAITFVAINGTLIHTSNRITSVSYSQSMEDYCRFLETEANNVVDRNLATHFSDLTCRADDILLNADTAKLVLPTRIESVSDFGFQLEGENLDFLIDVTATRDTSIETTEQRTYRYFAERITVQRNGTTVYILDDLFDNYLYKFIESKSDFYETYWSIVWIGYAYRFENIEHTEGRGKLECNDIILEETLWSMLPANQQSLYAVYSNGGQEITNLNSRYKNDIWNKIIGESRSNFIDNSNNIRRIYNECSIQVSILGDSIPERFKYYCDCVPMTNPVLYDEKSEYSLNEQSFKKYSRSYDNSASVIDFDKAVENMGVTNNTLGRCELVLEVDSSDLSYDNIPKATEQFSYNGNTLNSVYWYISSSITTITFEGKITTLNLVRNYNKKADCIGVDTQYKATKLDLKTIVDRPIFVQNSITQTLDLSKNYYFKLTFFDSDMEELNVAVVPAVVMNKGNIYYFYCEMEDHYSVGPYSETINVGGNSELKHFTYVTDLNECYGVNIQLGTIASLTRTQSYKLPKFTGAFNDLVSHYSILYKDARERLTFTFKLIKN